MNKLANDIANAVMIKLSASLGDAISASARRIGKNVGNSYAKANMSNWKTKGMGYGGSIGAVSGGLLGMLSGIKSIRDYNNADFLTKLLRGQNHMGAGESLARILGGSAIGAGIGGGIGTGLGNLGARGYGKYRAGQAANKVTSSLDDLASFINQRGDVAGMKGLGLSQNVIDIMHGSNNWNPDNFVGKWDNATKSVRLGHKGFKDKDGSQSIRWFNM